MALSGAVTPTLRTRPHPWVTISIRHTTLQTTTHATQLSMEISMLSDRAETFISGSRLRSRTPIPSTRSRPRAQVPRPAIRLRPRPYRRVRWIPSGPTITVKLAWASCWDRATVWRTRRTSTRPGTRSIHSTTHWVTTISAIMRRLQRLWGINMHPPRGTLPCRLPLGW